MRITPAGKSILYKKLDPSVKKSAGLINQTSTRNQIPIFSKTI
jgi:hypothetical protein